MKNYNEVTNDLLERRDRYVTEQKKKRKRVMSVATSLCCFCLVALLGFGMWQGEMFDTTPQTNLGEHSLNGDKEQSNPNKSGSLNNDNRNQESQGGQTTISENNDSENYDSANKKLFAINEITETISAALKYRDPKLHYKETWELAKSIDYLGVDIPNAVANLPDGIPEELDLKYTEGSGFTVVYENNGTLVEDRMCYEFVGNDGAKVMILASKLRMPYDCLYSSDTDDVTRIRIPATDEIIPVRVYAQGKTETRYSLYVADFEYDGVYYRIHIENLWAIHLDFLIREIVK